MNRRAHRRGDRRSKSPTTAAAWLVLLCLTALFACAGGSGSSGFDVVENAAIDQALDEQHCVDSGGLVICPADTTTGIQPTPRPTATPSATASPEPTTAGPTTETPPVDTPATRTAVRFTPTPTITRTVRATATATPAGMHIDVGLDRATAVDCMIVDGSCGFSFTFTAVGFPPGTSFLVASRPLAPEGLWQISIPVTTGGPTQAPSFDVLILVPTADPGQTIAVQVAVLAQSVPVDMAPASVDFLGESAAEFAFVTPELEVRPVP